jgi:hypothetical protein
MAPKKFDDMRTVGRMVQSLRWIMRYNEALRKSRGDVYDGLLSFGTRKFVRKEKRFPGSFERYLPRYEEVRVVQIPAPVVVPKPVYQIIEQPRLSFVQTGREGTDYFSGVRGRFGSSARQGELDLN